MFAATHILISLSIDSVYFLLFVKAARNFHWGSLLVRKSSATYCHPVFVPVVVGGGEEKRNVVEES